MTAIHFTEGTRLGAGRRLSSAMRAFTLTELLVVIALIVLLVTLLLGALSAVQSKARETRTVATMQAFANACDAFQQEQGFYPGVVPENIMASDADANANGISGFSGTENACLHLMGSAVRQADVGTADFNDLYPAGEGWQTHLFQKPNNNGIYPVKVNIGRIGDGPVINGKAYAPYFTPGEKEFGVAAGQLSVGMGPQMRPLPDVLDAWGQPIIYLRRMRSLGPITALNGDAQFDLGPIASYTKSESLGRMGGNQLQDSIFNTAPDPLNTLGRILGHPSLSSWDAPNERVIGQARGAYMLLSAGPDGVFFSQKDGPGSPGNPVSDILTDYDAGIIGEYDDVLIFGGD